MTDEQHQPDEQPERANTAIVRAWRFANRKKIDAAREQKLYERSPAGKLAKYWQRNFSKLTPEAQAEIQQQHNRASDLIHAATSTIAGIADGKIAGDSMMYPDALYADVKVFLAEYPPIHNWMHRATAAITPDDLENCDDIAFRDVGLDTRLPVFLVDEYMRWTLIWCERNPDLADAEVLSELRATVKSNIPAPTPASQFGLRQQTREESAATLCHNRHVAKIHQEILASRRDVPNV